MAAAPCATGGRQLSQGPLCRKVALLMSVPAPREPSHDGGRWETIRYALESNARTFRLCLIWLVATAAPVAAAVIAELIRHMLL